MVVRRRGDHSRGPVDARVRVTALYYPDLARSFVSILPLLYPSHTLSHTHSRDLHCHGLSGRRRSSRRGAPGALDDDEDDGCARRQKRAERAAAKDNSSFLSLSHSQILSSSLGKFRGHKNSSNNKYRRGARERALMQSGVMYLSFSLSRTPIRDGNYYTRSLHTTRDEDTRYTYTRI